MTERHSYFLLKNSTEAINPYYSEDAIKFPSLFSFPEYKSK